MAFLRGDRKMKGVRDWDEIYSNMDALTQEDRDEIDFHVKLVRGGGHMKKLSLKKAADEFDMINNELHLFYNTITGEFDFYTDYMEELDGDYADKFEDEEWVAAPSQRDIGDYDIMVDFAETITDPHQYELFSVALMGAGAFRRFRDVLERTDLEEEWYAFKHKAYVEIARAWCKNKGIEYMD